jgi:peptide-methionine (S)-S-oxide reductase
MTVNRQHNVPQQEQAMTNNSRAVSKPLPSLARIATGMAALAGAVFFCMHLGTAKAETAVKIAPPAFDAPAATASARETAVFAGGCFWGIQAVFQHTKGVLNAVSGYAGGTKETADYDKVSSGRTAHAESVQITYDPSQISYGKLLQIYFSVAHDPTQLNRQHPDTGPQYRSAVFYVNDSQKQITERYIAQLDAARSFPSKIVTQVAPLNAFYAAEKYHQDYATLHPESGYIATFDLPKIENLKKILPEVFRAQPVLVATASRSPATAQK